MSKSVLLDPESFVDNLEMLYSGKLSINSKNSQRSSKKSARSSIMPL